jgi:hypothetical protein
MGTTHAPDTRTAQAEFIRGAANAGSGAPKIHIGVIGMVLPSTGVLGVFTLTDFAAASGPTTTATGSAGAVAAISGGGEAAVAIMTDSDDNEVVRGACGVGTGEVQISTTTLADGDTVTLTADASWTAPP